MPFEQFPYTNFHELNEDWLIKTVKEVKDKADDIDASVADAQSAADAAAASELNAKASEDNAKASELNAKSYSDNVEDYTSGLESQISANTQGIAVNSARIDSFTSLAEGSTTGDAELHDIRIGADGTVYATAGDAVREQVSDLQSNIDAGISVVTNIANPANKVLNERFKGTDPVTTGAEANYQRLEVRVEEGKTYSIWNINTAFSYYSNASYAKIDVVDHQGNVTIPAGCDRLLLSYSQQNKEFVVINKANYPDATYIYNYPLEVNYVAFNVNDYASDIELMASTRNIADPANVVLNERYRNNNPVDTAAQANYQRLEVPVIAEKTYSVWNINTAFSLFSDDNFNNLGVISNEGNVTTPAGCTKMLLTYSQQNRDFIVINDKDFPNGTYDYNVPIDRTDNHYDYTSISMFPSIAVVGDSFESGGIYITEPSLWNMYYNLSWVSVMGRRCGSEMNNYSSAGLSTRSWLTNSKGLSKALSDAPSGLYLLCLGINDYGIADYLGTPADMTADYTQNPDTFYGNYARIFEQLANHAPNAKFIFVVPPLITSEYATAIENIASHYNVPCFRSLDDSFFTSEFYTDNRSTAHPVAMTYAGMALAYERLVSLCIQDNASYFFDYHME